ncbi:hypothetical protein SEVIR_5G468400v4 [Setaria viridis]|uniref:NB-ARC domain-containing protein n=2 Tax=Setaria TaxID=4554 RepID=A0A368RGA2_SETIT|nr:hypothetical protein SETIT_5G461900v2 [Setaria italica]TKW18985.1 hypothetical protein SEVIR_5G468400v2 [Setaria viridis]
MEPLPLLSCAVPSSFFSVAAVVYPGAGRLRQKALEDHEKETKKFLKKPTYLAYIDLLLADMDAAAKRQEAMESVNGFIRTVLASCFGRICTARHGHLRGQGARLPGARRLRRVLAAGDIGQTRHGQSTLLRIIHDNYSSYRPFEYILELAYGCTAAMFHDVFARTVGSRRNQTSSALLAKTISRRLEDKTFLLMLDDVRDDGIDLSAIGLPMPLDRAPAESRLHGEGSGCLRQDGVC